MHLKRVKYIFGHWRERERGERGRGRGGGGGRDRGERGRGREGERESKDAEYKQINVLSPFFLLISQKKLSV